jgi:hypothetical protein
MGDIPPCATIYVNNLNEKIKKDGASRDRAPDARTPAFPPVFREHLAADEP